MMNILYVWFPASWGPSVVEAIQTRNVTCLAKKRIVRDPHIFDRKEAARGSRARESHLSDPKVEHQGRGLPSYPGSKCKS